MHEPIAANLVIRPEKLGDLIVATPVFRAFKESFPNQPLHLLTDPAHAEVVRHDPFIDRIITVPWRTAQRRPANGWWSLIQTLAETRYGRCAILYANSNAFNGVCLAAGIRNVAQIGGTAAGLLLRHQMVLRKMHQSARYFGDLYLDVAAQLGAYTENACPALYILPEEVQKTHASFPWLQERKTIFLHAFGLTAFSNLTPPDYCELGVFLAENSDWQIVLLGTEAELRTINSCSHPRILLGCGRDLALREMLCLLQAGSAVVGGSSGLVHAAAALGVPSVGLFCPGHHHDKVWGPRGARVRMVVVCEEKCRRAGGVSVECPGTGFCNLRFGLPFDEIKRQLVEVMQIPTR